MYAYVEANTLQLIAASFDGTLRSDREGVYLCNTLSKTITGHPAIWKTREPRIRTEDEKSRSNF